MSGINTWPWELAVTYADILADICLNASTSVIRKRSLIGQNRDVRLVHRTSSTPNCPLHSAGLIDLVFFNAVQDSGCEGRIRLCFFSFFYDQFYVVNGEN